MELSPAAPCAFLGCWVLGDPKLSKSHTPAKDQSRVTQGLQPERLGMGRHVVHVPRTVAGRKFKVEMASLGATRYL